MTQDEQSEVGSNTRPNVSESGYGPLDDDAFARIADEAFQEYDAREAADEA